ncbi:MAG: thiol-disulfide oxidoreductase DCC family protein [Gemmataceae bacterium]
MKPILSTTPPGHYVVLYDGLCRFCTAQAGRLRRWTRADRVEFVDFQLPGMLERFPGLTHDTCMTAMQVIDPAGRIYSGFEGAVRILATLPVIGRLAYVYYVPGLRWACDRLYALIAARRYRIMKQEAAACTGTCSLHLRSRS